MIYKPAPPHNPLKAPGVCGCLDCCRQVLDLRCTATTNGHRCGDYKHRGKTHTLLVCSTFSMAEARLADALTEEGE